MDNFDPDTYLASKTSAVSGGFDPDAYLASKDESVGAMAKAYGLGVLNNFPMAKQAASAVLPGQYSQNLPNITKAAAQAKAAHPIPYGGGALTGAVAPAFLPGVGEALESAPIVGNALYGAAQGVSDIDLLKQPGEALKQAGIGAGLGATVGAVLPKGTKVQEGLETIANKQGIKSLGLNPRELGVPGEEIQNMGNLANEAGLFKGSTEERFNTAKDLVQQTGKQIEDLGEGKVLQNTQPYVQNLNDSVKNSVSVYGGTENPDLNIYRQAMANLQKPGGLSFEELQNLKNSAKAKAFDNIGNVKNDAAFDVYKEYSNAMEALASDHPEYPQLKQTYGQLRMFQNGLEKQLGTEQAQGAKAQGIGMMGRMGAAITGGNVPATLGAAAILGPAHPLWAASLASTIFGNPRATQTIARTAAKYAPRAVNATQEALTKYLTDKYGKTNETNR